MDNIANQRIVLRLFLIIASLLGINSQARSALIAEASFSTTSQTLLIGQTYNNKTLSCDNTTGTITYSILSCSEEGVVSINASTGKVTALKAGTAVIQASVAPDGEYENTATANYDITVEAVAASFGTTQVSMGVDDTYTNSTFTKNTSGTVTYSSDRTAIASVNATTGEVTALRTGIPATITATVAAWNGTDEDGDTYTIAGTTASYTVSVTDPSATPVRAGTENTKAIVCKKGDSYYAMTTTISDGVAGSQSVTIRDGSVVVKPNLTVANISWNITVQKGTLYNAGSKIRIKTGSNYLKKGSSNDLGFSLTSFDWLWNTDKNAYATEASGTSGVYTFLYRTSAGGFKAYAVSNIPDYSEAARFYPIQYEYEQYKGSSTSTKVIATSVAPTLLGNELALYSVAEGDKSKLDGFKDNANVVINGTAQLFSVTDKTDYYAPTSFTTAKRVTYSRTNTQGYNTVCLPFDVNLTGVKPFGTDSKVYVLGSTTAEGSARIAFSEKSTGTIEAGTPFLVYNEGDTPWSLDLSGTIPVNGTASEVTESVTDLGGEVKIIGSYVQQYLGEVEGLYKLNSEGTYFVATSSSSTISPFRFYLDMRNAGVSPAKMELFLFHDDGTESSVTMPFTTKDDDEPWHDLSGRQVTTPSQRGIYVKGNKKIIVK